METDIICPVEEQHKYERKDACIAMDAVRIREVTGDRRAYLPLLLLADEQRDMVERYLGSGTMWVLEDSGMVGEVLVTDEDGGLAEVKSLAVDPRFQGRGYGRALLDFAARACADRGFHALQVGTGDSPLTVPFYEQCGFVRHHVVPDFFTDNYDHPIWEDGVRLVDMVYLQKRL